MPQQAFRCHDDQWLAEGSQHLPPDHVKHLCGCRGYANLHIVFGTELQKTFQARGRMFGTLPFVAMWQEQGQAAEPSPLRLAGTDELVDDNLRAVREVTELAFPDRQGSGLGRGVTVFERHDRLFGQ